MRYKTDDHPVQLRKARTKSLIQLGALIEKTRLLENVDLETGQNLQKDPEAFEGVATLMGALLSLKDIFHSKEGQAQKLLWAARGKEALARNHREQI